MLARCARGVVRARRADAVRVARGAAMTTARDVEEANAILADAFGGALKDATGGAHASLTHVNSAGTASMVNVGAKATTSRVASASARVWIGAEAYALVRANAMKKGDVLSTARLAGIMGAKRTADLIPLCHSLALDQVKVELEMVEAEYAIDVTATAACSGKTGVEMEALTAATVSGLTIYDMCKAVSKDIVIGDVRLESKSGGKSGDWTRVK